MTSLASLEKRLARIEARLFPPECEPTPPMPLAPHLVSYHVGGWRPDNEESIAEAYARAARYASSGELARTMRSDPDEFNRRHAAALAAMLAAEGADLDLLIEAAEKGGMRLPEGVGSPPARRRRAA